MRRLLALVVILFVGTPAWAIPGACSLAHNAVTPTTTSHLLLNDVALNDGTAANRTFTVYNLDGNDTLAIDFKYTHANNGTLTFTCTGKRATKAGETEDNTVLTTGTLSSGTFTLIASGIVVTPSLSANTVMDFVLGVKGQSKMSCLVEHGGTPNASDKITVTARKCG